MVGQLAIKRKETRERSGSGTCRNCCHSLKPFSRWTVKENDSLGMEDFSTRRRDIGKGIQPKI